MVSQTLPAGSTLRAYGYDKTGNWYLVGSSEGVLGYVSGDLLQQAGGNEPMLAGGAPKRPRLCRTLELSITTGEAGRQLDECCVQNRQRLGSARRTRAELMPPLIVMAGLWSRPSIALQTQSIQLNDRAS